MPDFVVCVVCILRYYSFVIHPDERHVSNNEIAPAVGDVVVMQVKSSIR